MNDFLEELVEWARTATHVPKEVRASIVGKVKRYVAAMGGNTKSLIELGQEMGFDQEYYRWFRD